MPRELDAQNTPVYRDTQRLSPWVYGVLIAIMGFLGYIATTLPHPGSIVLASAAALVFLVGLIIAFFSRMMTEVSATEVRGRFGLYQFAIPLQRIVRAEVVEVGPWSSENWGVRGAAVKGGFVGLRGRRGVKLCFSDGLELVLGCDRPEGLAEAIRSRLAQTMSSAPSA
jgi:hypothetical protein